MSMRRLMAGLLIASAATRALGQSPEAELQGAVDRLFAAGSYTWAEKEVIDFDSKGRGASPRMPNSAEGETEIDGFTLLTSFRRSLVLFRSETAFRLKTGWRHAADLTNEELEELRFVPSLRMSQDFIHRYTHVLPHELLRVVLPAASNVRKDGAALVGDVDPARLRPLDLEQFITLGRMPTHPQPTRLGLPLPAPAPTNRNDSSSAASFVVWLAGGAIEEFRVEFVSDANISLNGGPRERHHSTRAYTFKLQNIGSTRVVVDPEAKALFLAANAGR